MATIRRFEDLKVWQLARELTRDVYAVSGQDAFARDFELRNQIRAAAGSVMHTSAEGFDSGSDAEFIRFLRYARRSATEVQSELYVAIDQQYINQTDFDRIYAKAKECKKSINGMIGYLKSSQ